MDDDIPTLVFVGAGPRTSSLLERLAANAQELLPEGPVHLHIVDPYPPGGGRIWRHDQSPLLWMNSVAADVTMFTDESVRCVGPVRTGPSLPEWVRGAGRHRLALAGLRAEAEVFQDNGFPSRRLQSQYLGWFFEEAVVALPPRVTVSVHARRGVGLRDRAGDSDRQELTLDDGRVIVADLVVLAQGYLEHTPEAADGLSEDLLYVAPGYTADLDLSGIAAGESVIVRGFGLAFIDLMVLLTQERGGAFVTGDDGELGYRPSGREPVLHVGSRRGVPYHAKLGYPLPGAGPAAPVFMTPAVIAGDGGPVDFDRDIWPLVVRELTYAHYRELFTAHPDRVTGTWEQAAAVLFAADFDLSWFDGAVPDARDRFDLAAVDRPLATLTFGTAEAAEAAIADHICQDLLRRRDSRYSMDGAVFQALLAVYGALVPLLSDGRLSIQDRITRVEGNFHGLFSFLASGPPPQRLAELLALHRAGLVHFLGPDLGVTRAGDHFLARSPAVPGDTAARIFVEARLPRPDVLATADPLVAGLLADGELSAEVIVGPRGPEGGQLLADARCRAVRADGSVHRTRFLLGPGVTGSAGSNGFSRPGYNSPFLRQNDAVARDLWRGLAESAAVRRNAGARSRAG